MASSHSVTDSVPLRPCSPLWVQFWAYKPDDIEQQRPLLPHVEAMTLHFQRNSGTSNGSCWESCSHPEGRIYFHRLLDPGPGGSKRVALTNSDISDPTVHTRAEDAFYRVAEMLHQRPETPTDTQIVLDIRSDADWYYCLSWTLRRVFWPVQTSVSLTSGSGIDVFDLSHLESRNEALFWTHVTLFPSGSGASVPISELESLLNFAYVDIMTSETSTITVDKDTLVTMRSVVESLARNSSHGDGASMNGHSIWIVARVMQMFCNSHFFNRFGQPDAILSWSDVISRKTGHASAYFFFVSLLLFNWPRLYRKAIKDISANGNIHLTRGHQFIADMKADWEGSTTPATILLTANVSLLAIQSIDNSKGDPGRSVAQISCYASLILSLANYITCQILLRQHRKMISSSTTPLYSLQPTSGKNELEIMAIAFSLPQGFFIWSMLTFLLSVCWILFWQTSLVTRAILATLLSALVFLVSVLLYLSRQHTLLKIR